MNCHIWFLMSDAKAAIIYKPSHWSFDSDVDGDGSDDSNVACGGEFNRAHPNRHTNGANYLFSDGHVEWRSMGDWETNADGLWN